MACASPSHPVSPPPKGTPPKIRPAQRRALVGLRDAGNAAYGLKGRAAYGGFRLTYAWLQRQDLVWNFGGRDQLSARGARVLEAGRLVP